MKTAAVLLLLAVFAAVTNSQERPALYRIEEDAGVGFIDATGRVVIPPQFVWASEFRDGHAEVTICGGEALIDEKGFITKAPVYSTSSWSFSEGLRAFENKEGKVGFEDENGNEVIRPRFSDVAGFSLGVAVACESFNKCGYIDRSGEWVRTPVYNQTFTFADEGYAFINDERGVRRVIDRNFAYIYNTGEPSAGSFPHEGLMVSSIRGKFGYVRKDGTVAITPQFSDADVFSQGLAAVSRDGELFGYINPNAEMVIAPVFKDAQRFSEGLAAVRRGSEGWEYIDTTGRTVISLPEANWANPFDGHGIARIEGDNSAYGYVDRRGTVIWWGKNRGAFSRLDASGGWKKRQIEKSCRGYTNLFADVLKRALANAGE